MKPLLISTWLVLALCLPAQAQYPEATAGTGNRSVQMKLRNGSTVAGNILYVSPDGKIVELQTASGNQPVWYNDVTAVRRDKEGKRWRERPHPWTFRQRYDPQWEDPCRWEFGFYGNYGFGVGADSKDRYEVGINLRYGVNQYLFLGVGGGINSMRDINNGVSRKVNTTGCAVFADIRGYFRNHGVRPFLDMRIGYNFPTSTYDDDKSRIFTDKGALVRFAGGAAVVDRSDIAYSLSVGYQMQSVKLTELNKKSRRTMSGALALELAITFRW